MIVLRWSSEHKLFEDQGKQECLCDRRKLRRNCGTFDSVEELGEVD
jgi:hypothetical protein